MHVQIAPGRCGEKQHASPRMPRCTEKDEYIPYNYDLTNADFKGHEVSRVISESRELIMLNLPHGPHNTGGVDSH